MKLIIFRALWGMTGPIEEQIERIAAAGYDGVEGFPAPEVMSCQEYRRLVNAHGLQLIVGAQVSATEEIEAKLLQLAEYEPLKIGLHSGRDSMTRDEGRAFFEQALKIEERIGIPVAHETHRGRMFFSPWDTAYYLRAFDTLKVLADYSHWVNVCERLPDDQVDALTLANQRAIHIHGRVGYEEGPQVPHPSAPEYAPHLAWHEKHWQTIRQLREAEGDEILTVTPEYGPPNYLHTLPHTNVPVADLWQVCVWGMERARQVLG